MPSDDERDTRTKNLTDRDGFVAWKRTMRLVAMDKGDVYGLFDEDGTKGTYATATAGAGGAAVRRKWNELSLTLIGTLGKKIENATLQHIWSREYERVATQGAGPPDERPFVVALAMAALERECAQANTVGAGIARSQFIIALQSFTEDEKKKGADGKTRTGGFTVYADRVREAERKLSSLGVHMTDEEKKQMFFTYFSGTHNETWRISLSTWQDNDGLSFDEILQKGVQKQQRLDLDASTAASSQIKAFTARDADVEGEYRIDRGGKTKDAHFMRKGKGRTGRGRGGGGRNGGRGGNGNKTYKVAPKFEGTCWKCGKKGHKADECWSGKGGKGKGGGKGGKGRDGAKTGQKSDGHPSGFFVTGFAAMVSRAPSDDRDDNVVCGATLMALVAFVLGMVLCKIVALMRADTDADAHSQAFSGDFDGYDGDEARATTRLAVEVTRGISAVMAVCLTIVGTLFFILYQGSKIESHCENGA